jgi:TolA-binding protein
MKRILITMCVCCEISTVCGASESALEAFNKAAAMVREGNYAEALVNYRVAMKDDRFSAEHPEVYYWAGQAAVLGKQGEATELIEKALDLCGDIELRKKARFWLAQAKYEKGDMAGTLAALDSGEIATEYKRRGEILRVRALSKTGGTEAIRAAVDAVLPATWLDKEIASTVTGAAARIKKVSSDEVMLSFLKGLVEKGGPEVRTVAARLGAYEAAKLGRNSEAANFLSNLGEKGGNDTVFAGALELLKTEDYTAAAEKLAQVAAGSDSGKEMNLLAVQLLVEAYVRGGRLRDAFGVIVKQGASEWAADALIRIAQQAAMKEDWSLVKAAPEVVWVAEVPGEKAADLRYLEGWAYLKTGDKGCAAKVFLEYVEKYPKTQNAPEVLFLAAECLCDTGQKPEAEKAMRLLEKLYPDSPYVTGTSKVGEPAAIDVKNLPGDKTGKVGDKK